MRSLPYSRFDALRDFLLNRYELKRFPSSGGKRAPFALILPGGGYGCVMSCIEGEPYARALNERGYHAFVLRYHVRGKGRLPVPQNEVARALAEILRRADEWNVDPAGYSLWGSSAGGHLAASFCTEELGYAHYDLPKPAALILSYPVVTMGAHTHAGSRNNLLGKAPTQTMIERTSVERLIDGDYPPTFVWNTAEDEIVEPINSELLNDALSQAGVAHAFVCYPHGKHGQGLAKGTACEDWFSRAVQFWETQRTRLPNP